MSSSLPLERIYGTIYGNCIGDAIGLLTEFMTKDEARHHYHQPDGALEYGDKVHDSHRSRWKNGDWTDDSDQMILMMLSIIDQKGQVVAKDYGRKIKKWSRKGFPELGDKGGYGLGATTYSVLQHKKFDENPHIAAKEIWESSGCKAAPNGAVMRTSLMGIYQYQDLETVTRNTLEFCKVTHADYRCQASCVAVTTALALMLQGKHMTSSNNDFDVKAITDESFDRAQKLIPEGKHQKEYIKDLRSHMYAESLKELKLDEPRKIGYTYKTLGAGFWAFRQNDFRLALQQIVMEAGDADTNGAVAGALLGCKLGVTGLPESWLYGLVNKNWLDEKTRSFIDFAFAGSVKAGPEPRSTRRSDPAITKSYPVQEEYSGGSTTSDYRQGRQISTRGESMDSDHRPKPQMSSTGGSKTWDNRPKPQMSSTGGSKTWDHRTNPKMSTGGESMDWDHRTNPQMSTPGGSKAWDYGPKPQMSTTGESKAWDHRPKPQMSTTGGSKAWDYGPKPQMSTPGGSKAWDDRTNPQMSSRSEGMAGNMNPSHGTYSGDGPDRKAPMACSNQNLCDRFIHSLKLKDEFFDRKYDMCFCADCFRSRGDKPFYLRGNPQAAYNLPLGWCRFGLKLPATAHDFFKDWHVAFQSATVDSIKKIIELNLHHLDGIKLRTGKGHYSESSKHPMKSGHKLFYVYPYIAYAADTEHAQPRRWTETETSPKHNMQVVLQVRIKPGSYEVTKGYLGVANQPEMKGHPKSDNCEQEWSTENMADIIVTGILVRSGK